MDEWSGHQHQHNLEDRALALALARVADNAAALDRALVLAVQNVDELHGSMRELISAKIDALTETFRVDHEQMVRRWEAHKLSDSIAKDAADAVYESAWRAHMREHELNQRAVDIADRNMLTRLDEMNGLRTQIATERGSYVSRDMLDARLHATAETANSGVVAMTSRIGALERAQNIAFGIMLVLVFAIPLGLKFIP